MTATTLIERVQLRRFKTLKVTSHSLQIWLGLAALTLGVFVCVVGRPSALSVFPESIVLFEPTVRFFGMANQSLWAFVHVLAFSVRTAVFLGNGRYVALGASATWFLISSTFELGQQLTITPQLVEFVPSWLQIPILDRTAAYFRHGTFDFLDVVFITAGASAAYLVIEYIRLRRTSHG